MSLHVAVWHSERALSDKEAADLYLKLYEQRRTPIEQHIDVYSFYNELGSRYPEIDLVSDDQLDSCPWSCEHDRSGFHVIMSMIEEKAPEVMPFILELAEKHGLVCFDPQTRKVHLPSDLQVAAEHPGGTLHIICMNEGQQPPEYQLGFSTNGSSRGAMRMVQIVGEDELVNYLVDDIGIDFGRVDRAIENLKNKGQTKVFDLPLTDEDLIVLGLR